MCGICGAFNSSPDATVDASLLKKMTDAMVHRGPDDEGIYVYGNRGVGMRRLSIIDISTGHQPIFNEDKSVAVVFNGEIYNFQELRSELLDKGHRFSTRSDTEVIVHLYEDYGEELAKRIRGMFAIAVLDRKKDKLVLIRDRIGIKPLYYCVRSAGIIFASEIKALLATGAMDREIDLESLDDYLTYTYSPSPKTIFKNIKSLLPGHILTYRKGGAAISKYWDLANVFKEGAAAQISVVNESSAAEELFEILKNAVREELISDVPLGAFLSGGIDSSAVVILMQEILGKDVKTFSIGFDQASYNELGYAREIAKKYETDHHEMVVRPSMINLLPRLVDFLDEPFADSSIVPTYLVSKLAREKVTVALSGDGGDEFFGGYSWTKVNYLLQRYRFLPLAARNLIYKSANCAPFRTVFWSKMRRLARCGCGDYMEGFFKRIVCFDNEMKSSIYRGEIMERLKDYTPYGIIRDFFDNVRGIDAGSSMLYADASAYLPDDNLKKVDRMSMANSLEVRVPLLDHRIMEFASRIPFNLKIRGLTTKYIFKKAFGPRMPPKVTKQRKHGFSMPVHDWFRGELKDYSKQLLLNPKARIYDFLKPEPVSLLLSAHQEGKENLGNNIFALIMLELWLNKFVTRNP